MTDSPDGLEGDPSRRASATVRGFHYQFWRTVEAWIDLGHDEVLFVEGAEDFDRVSKGKATAVQVKDDRASGSLTLTSAKALGALGNFWNLIKANRGIKIRFQFITTAEAGFESDGFDGRKGIEVWNLCARSPFESCSEDVATIRDFLLKRKSLDRSLAKCLKDTSADTIHRELIKPLEWLYDQPGLDDMHDIVVGRLWNLGREGGLTATDAARLGNELYMMVVAAAIKQEPQRLTFIAFVEQLDRAVYVEVRRDSLRQREASGRSLGPRRHQSVHCRRS